MSLLAFTCYAKAEPITLVTTAVVKKQALEENLHVYGRVQADPAFESAVSLSHAGIIAETFVRPGQRVKGGDPLFVLVTAPMDLQAYRQGQVALQFARSEELRIRRLLAEQLATQDQLAIAKRATRDAAEVMAAQESLVSGHTREIVRASADGVVTSILVSAGQQLAAGSTILTVADSGKLTVLLGVEVEDIDQITVGMTVHLRPILQPDREITGAVSAVHAMINPATRLVDVLVAVPAHGASELLLGSMLEGGITLRMLDLWTVPKDAVLRDSTGAFVFVVEGHHAIKTPVVTKLESNGNVGIEGPLNSGMEVVTTGNYELKDGAKIRKAAF